MKYLARQIVEARLISENENFSDTEGIPQSVFIRFFNDAQDRLQSRILSANPAATVFDAEEVISVESNKNDYSLAPRTALDNIIRSVKYRANTTTDSYCNLSYIPAHNLLDYPGEPSEYHVSSGELLLSPKPESGLGELTVRYPRALDDLDIRRGTIQGRTLDVGETNLLTITLEDDSLLDDEALSDAEWVTVNDSKGNVTFYNIPIDSYDSSTNTLTVSAGTLIENGTVGIGDYIAIGPYSTTHSKLPQTVERYLIQYCVWKILKLDSSVDSTEAEQELFAIEADIVSQYKDSNKDIKKIPIINSYWT